jgi:hypothetical protein
VCLSPSADRVSRFGVPVWQGALASGLYVAGWLKRGPSGIIATNIMDARETVKSIVHDIKEGVIKEPEVSEQIEDVAWIRNADLRYLTIRSCIRSLVSVCFPSSAPLSLSSHPSHSPRMVSWIGSRGRRSTRTSKRVVSSRANRVSRSRANRSCSKQPAYNNRTGRARENELGQHEGRPSGWDAYTDINCSMSSACRRGARSIGNSAQCNASSLARDHHPIPHARVSSSSVMVRPSVSDGLSVIRPAHSGDLSSALTASRQRDLRHGSEEPPCPSR